MQCKCAGNVACFVSNVDLFFILFNNKLSTICPKLVRLGVLVGGSRESIDHSIKMGMGRWTTSIYKKW